MITKRPPTPRPGVYELYWKFASERQKVFEARLKGEPGPWTDDPIISNFKFCNVFRATDRVTQYLLQEVAYKDDDSSMSDRLFQVLAFRMFSRPETWDRLTNIIGHSPRIADISNNSLEAALEQMKADGDTLYTGAFILCAADAYGKGRKHLNHVELFRDMFITQNLADKLLAAKSLKEIYDLIHTFPLMGDFMSYQIAIDLNYTKYINFSENDFTQPGPGAVRGMKKVFIDLGDFTPAETIMWMAEHQEEEFKRFGLPFSGLFGRKLHAIDAQGLFCETDKYCREAIPELASARSRIKARFSENPKPVVYFFPPKWNLSDTV